MSPRGASELRSMVSLAWPVVLAELGWMAMGVVDTIMVGTLGPAAIGAVGLASAFYVALAIFGMGLLLGLDTLVSRAFGARDLPECHRWLIHGVALAIAISVPLMIVGWLLASTMPGWGLHPSVLRLTEPYFMVVLWGTPPLLLYAAFRRYLQAIDVVRPVMLVLVTANLVNFAGNWLLIFGRLGLPPLGVVGSAWSTVIGRLYMAAALAAVIIWHDRLMGGGLFAGRWRIEAARMRVLLALGTPAAMQVTAEVGVFAAVTALAGRLDPVALASHQIALNVASVTYMVPLGISSAGAVRVGQALGRQDPRGAGHAGWTALAIGAAFMACAAIALITVPAAIIRLFTRDLSVLPTAISLLAIAAAFQLFDGLQTVATGVLRGAGDTKTPMLSNLGGHWLLGLPIGYLLCFSHGWGVRGLWMGLCIGLVIVALVLVAVWAARVRGLHAAMSGVAS